MPDHLGLDDDPALVFPLPRRVPGFAAEVLGLAAGLGQHPRAAHQPAAALDEAHIAGHRHHVFDPLGLQELEDLGAGEAPIEADAEDRPREGHPQDEHASGLAITGTGCGRS